MTPDAGIQAERLSGWDRIRARLVRLQESQPRSITVELRVTGQDFPGWPVPDGLSARPDIFSRSYWIRLCPSSSTDAQTKTAGTSLSDSARSRRATTRSRALPGVTLRIPESGLQCAEC